MTQRSARYLEKLRKGSQLLQIVLEGDFTEVADAALAHLENWIKQKRFEWSEEIFEEMWVFRYDEILNRPEVAILFLTGTTQKKEMQPKRQLFLEKYKRVMMEKHFDPDAVHHMFQNL